MTGHGDWSMLRKVRERLHPRGPFRRRPPVTLRERVGIMLFVPRGGTLFRCNSNGSQARGVKSSAWETIPQRCRSRAGLRQTMRSENERVVYNPAEHGRAWQSMAEHGRAWQSMKERHIACHKDGPLHAQGE